MLGKTVRWAPQEGGRGASGVIRGQAPSHKGGDPGGLGPRRRLARRPWADYLLPTGRSAALGSFSMFAFGQKSFVLLDDRGVVRVSGPDARSFLQGLVTNDVNRAVFGRVLYAA